VDCSEAYIIRGAMTVTGLSRLESNMILAIKNAVITGVHGFHGLIAGS
jgi:hypothetical protein